eukprot:TRINITY_DN27040_c0_g1_i1.p1 TRINITY_DN27040_c0_g1~~TRINITY_DN27040_c0_g1_i1.p1  ORF type:complete len:226 (-),score=12.47 TRINITY_DN27040_c0_g1_i1:20-697(-)
MTSHVLNIENAVPKSLFRPLGPCRLEQAMPATLYNHMEQHEWVEFRAQVDEKLVPLTEHFKHMRWIRMTSILIYLAIAILMVLHFTMPSLIYVDVCAMEGTYCLSANAIAVILFVSWMISRCYLTTLVLKQKKSILISIDSVCEDISERKDNLTFTLLRPNISIEVMIGSAEEQLQVPPICLGVSCEGNEAENPHLTSSTPNFCPNCGAQNTAKGSFCAECGQML